MAVPAPRTVNVFGSDQETTPLAVFEVPVTVPEIRDTLGIGKGGLKRRGGAEVFVTASSLSTGGDFTFIGMPKFVLQVTFLGTVAMVNVKSPKSKVRSLVAEIAAHFSSLVAGDPADTKIAELRSNGVLLNLNDTIDNVLTDGSSVQAVDFKAWSEQILKNCDYSKLKVLQAELDEKQVDKWLETGHVKGTPKVYVTLGQGYQKAIKYYKLELLDPESLQHYPKDGRHLIAYADGTSDEGNKWVLEAHVRVSKGVGVAIELSAKSSTSSRATIIEIAVSIKDGQIAFGEKKTIQNNNPVVDKKYVLPAAKSTGPTLDKEAAADAAIPKEKQRPAQTFTPGPDMGMTINCKHVWAEQKSGRGDEWFMCYYLALEHKNPQDVLHNVTKTEVSYQGVDGAWVVCKNDNVNVGRWSGGWRFDWDFQRSAGGKFQVAAKQEHENAIRAAFGMPKSIPCGERRRTHRSMPQPLKMRLVFTTIDGKTATLEVTQVNDEPLALPTKESRFAKDKKEITRFLYVDDASAETRTWVEVLVPETQNEWQYVPVSWEGSSKYVYLSDLRKWAYTAIKEGKSEVLIDDIKKDDKMKCFGLIDSQLGQVYALRFELTSATSSVTDYVVMPHLATPYD